MYICIVYIVYTCICFSMMAFLPGGGIALVLVVSPSLVALLAEVKKNHQNSAIVVIIFIVILIHKSCFHVFMFSLPSHLCQVYKCCLYEGCCGRNATDWIYLIVYPLFTGLMIMMINMMIRQQQRKISVIMLALLSCHPACFIQFI